jgi:hypothetical protein
MMCCVKLGGGLVAGMLLLAGCMNPQRAVALRQADNPEAAVGQQRELLLYLAQPDPRAVATQAEALLSAVRLARPEVRRLNPEQYEQLVALLRLRMNSAALPATEDEAYLSGWYVWCAGQLADPNLVPAQLTWLERVTRTAWPQRGRYQTYLQVVALESLRPNLAWLMSQPVERGRLMQLMAELPAGNAAPAGAVSSTTLSLTDLTEQRMRLGALRQTIEAQLYTLASTAEMLQLAMATGHSSSCVTALGWNMTLLRQALSSNAPLPVGGAENIKLIRACAVHTDPAIRRAARIVLAEMAPVQWAADLYALCQKPAVNTADVVELSALMMRIEALRASAADTKVLRHPLDLPLTHYAAQHDSYVAMLLYTATRVDPAVQTVLYTRAYVLDVNATVRHLVAQAPQSLEHSIPEIGLHVTLLANGLKQVQDPALQKTCVQSLGSYLAVEDITVRKVVAGALLPARAAELRGACVAPLQNVARAADVPATRYLVQLFTSLSEKVPLTQPVVADGPTGAQLVLGTLGRPEVEIKNMAVAFLYERDPAVLLRGLLDWQMQGKDADMYVAGVMGDILKKAPSGMPEKLAQQAIAAVARSVTLATQEADALLLARGLAELPQPEARRELVALAGKGKFTWESLRIVCTAATTVGTQPEVSHEK